jgi:hypothetical protein
MARRGGAPSLLPSILRVSTLLAALVAFLQLRSCTSAICAAASFRGGPFAARTLSSPSLAPQGAVVLSGDAVATLTKPANDAWRVVVSGSRDELPAVSHAREFGGGALLPMTGGRWWFASAGVREETYGTTFLTGSATEGEVRESFVPHPRLGPNLLLPLPATEPRALHLSYTGNALEALEVSPAGIGRTWRMEPPARRTFLAGDWSAEALPDGRIAVVAIEHDGPDESRIVLRLLDDGARVVATTLQQARVLSQLATAIDSGGQLVVATVVARPAGSTIEATRLDPSSPAAAWRDLSEAGAFSPRVAATPDGIVVAWLRSSRALQFEARDLSGAGEAIVIGAAGGRTRFDSFATVQPGDDDQLTFVWTDDAGRLTARTLVAPLAGFAFAERLREWSCSN